MTQRDQSSQPRLVKVGSAWKMDGLRNIIISFNPVFLRLPSIDKFDYSLLVMSHDDDDDDDDKKDIEMTLWY
jgi:hypothetical protein